MTNESLIDSALPSEGGDQAPNSTPATPDAAATQQPASPAPTLLEPEKKEEPAKPEVKPEAEKPKVELVYDIKVEGQEIDTATLDEFVTLAKEVNLSPEAAQKVAQFGPKMVEAFVARQAAVVQKQVDSWEESVRNDPELGGDNLEKNLATAKKALDLIASPELSQLLGRFDPEKNPTGLGLGNHPAIVKALYKIGASISEDGFVSGQGPRSAQRPEDVIYDNTKKK